METNKFSPKDESKEKLILLEALLSKSIISFMCFFPPTILLKMLI